jgi:hypothetical protein
MGRWFKLPRNGWARLWTCVVGFLAALALGNEVAIYLTEARLNQRREAARAAGLPGSLDEIAGPAIAKEDNAAIPLAEAADIAEQMQKAIIRKVGNVDDFTMRTSACLAIASAEITKHPEYEAAVLDADRRRGYRTLLAIEPPLLSLDFTAMQRMRCIARLEVLRAEQLTAQGKREEGAEILLRLLRLTRKLEAEPLLFRYLVGIALRGQAMAGLNRALRTGLVSSATHDAVERELAQHEKVYATLRRALATERPLMAEAYWESFPALAARPGRAYANDARAFLWDVVDWHVLHAEDSVSARNQSKEERATITSDGSNDIWLLLRHPGVRMLPAFQLARGAADRVVVYARCLRIVNAIQRRSTKPTSMKELGLPEKTLEDPFAEAPLKWIWKPEGVVVYSVGPDLVDDGGPLLPTVTNNNKTFDIGFGPEPAAVAGTSSKKKP